jgi:predicted GNAT family acetyltransferase
MVADFAAEVAAGHVVVIGTAGAVDGYMIAWPETDAYLIDNIAIDPARQGQGLGRRLMDHAVGEAKRRRLSTIRLVWGFLCQGCITPFLSRVVTPFFCSTRAASILPSRPHIAVAVARSGGQGRRFFSAAEGLSFTNASTAAGCP